MGFWDYVNDEMKKAVGQGISAVKEGAKLGRLKLRVHTLHKKAEGLFAELGGIVYDMARPPLENPLSRPEVIRLVAEIKKIEKEAALLEEEMKKARGGASNA
ncbi:MAG: hypothetical protein AAB356_05675 [Deltaproteobacteria bacterium]